LKINLISYFKFLDKLLILLSILPIFNIIGESEKKKVLVGKIDNNIDPRTNRYSKLLGIGLKFIKFNFEY